MFLEIYIKWRALVHKLRNYLNFLKFIKFLWQNKIFESREPVVILELVQKFIELQSSEYGNKIVMNRDVKRSVLLLKALTRAYLDNRSETNLNQLLTVLKQEFIERNHV